MPIKPVPFVVVQSDHSCRVQTRDQNIQATALQLLNRLSDWLFVASRAFTRC